MDIKRPFEKGVLGMLSCTWDVVLQTPLVIRSASHKAAFKQQADKEKKGRGMDVDFNWQNAESKLNKNDSKHKEYSEVTDLNYHFFIENNQMKVEYHIPASSIRGALRNAAIKRLVEQEVREAFTIKKAMTLAEIEEKLNNARRQLEERKNGWFEILSLFGIAFDILPEDDNPLTWCGRMRLMTEMKKNSINKPIECSGQQIQSADGPRNIKRHITVRNPLDRVTMAAKEGGLHFGSEMSEGETFQIHFHILNPKPSDLDLLKLWHDDINDGFLRFGGLTSQGRGRVKIENQSYRLFVSAASSLFAYLKSLGKSDIAKDTLYDGFWFGAELSYEELRKLDLMKLESN